MAIKTILPNRLKPGSHIRVIAPSLSMAILSQETIRYATDRFKQMDFILSFGKHVHEIDLFGSSSLESRLADLHDAFSDTSVDAVLMVIGGYNSNQLLEHIDWSLLKNNPKVFCGYSDITILNNAILSQTGLINYYGPAFSTFGQKIFDEYTLDYFLKALTTHESFFIPPASTWSDDAWFVNQDNRTLQDNEGLWIIQEGYATGMLVGGHLGTFCLLQGTKYMPSLNGKILIIEEDADPANPREFDRRLQSLLQQPEAEKLAGVLIGRFEKSYGMTKELLIEIIKGKTKLHGKPVIANVDFGHTEPHCTLPIGGVVEIKANNSTTSIQVLV